MFSQAVHFYYLYNIDKVSLGYLYSFFDLSIGLQICILTYMGKKYEKNIIINLLGNLVQFVYTYICMHGIYHSQEGVIYYSTIGIGCSNQSTMSLGLI